MKSWSNGTSKQYSSQLNRWFKFCSENGIDPCNATISNGAQFLTDYFIKSNCDYSSVNTARSALSAIFPLTEGCTFGNHPIIQRLLRGIFKEKPSFPKYSVTYDVKKVFDYIQHCKISEETSLDILSKVLATFMCMLSDQRSQTFASISMDYLHLEDTRCIFYIPTLLKTSRPTFHQEPLRFKAYDDKTLCVVTLIDFYVKKTKDLRPEHSTFFISYVPPHKSVTSKTIARWVTDILDNAGINIKTYKAHSVRSASSSSAHAKGLSLKEIGKAAGWTNFKTFGKFYKKPIEEENFGSVLLL